MIRVLKHSQNHRCNFYFSDYFQFKSSYLMLLTQNVEEHSLYQRINHIILEKILHENFEDLDSPLLLKRLKEFFIELNWQVFSLLSNQDVPEKGISLAFCLVRENTLYFVQFGRLLAGVVENKNFKTIGKSWENFNILTMKQLFLLGSLDENISIKVHKISLESQDKFFILPSTILSQVNKEDTFTQQIGDKLGQAYKVHTFPYFVAGRERTIVSRKTTLLKSKVRNTIAVLFLIIMISLSYVFFGNNIFEDRLNIEKERIVEEIKNFPIEQIEEYGMSIVAPKSIQFETLWKAELDNKITQAPRFDHRRLYIILDKKLKVYSKRTQKTVWNKEFKSQISSLQLLDNDLMLVYSKNKEITCLNRKTGEIQWERKNYTYTHVSEHLPIVISNADDMRLTTSILLTYQNKELQINESITGDTLATYQFQNEVNFISKYDLYDKCIYTVSNKKLNCLKLKVNLK